MTIAGVHRLTKNPGRRWWQVWKPRLVATEELQTFAVLEVARQGVPAFIDSGLWYWRAD